MGSPMLAIRYNISWPTLPAAPITMMLSILPQVGKGVMVY